MESKTALEISIIERLRNIICHPECYQILYPEFEVVYK